MPRLVGLAWASKLYRELDELKAMTQFSRNGDEIALGTIGNASCAEGMFWESLNAAGVMRRADGRLDLGRRLRHLGPERVPDHEGQPLRAAERLPARAAERSRAYDIYTVKGWDYPALCETYVAACDRSCAWSTCRRSCTSSR